MKQTKKKKKGIGKKILLVLVLLLLVIGGIFAYKVHKNGGGLKGLLATAVGHDQETVKTLPKIYAVLLGQSQNLTDTIMVAEYYPQKQQASILSIPRDTFIGNNKNTATPWDKINAVYQTGPENVLKEINELTGLDIKYYIKVDTEAFKALVDAIGGVTFDVPIDMKYTDKKQGLYINLKAGVQKLDGDKAEQVVRFRHNSDGSTYPAEYGIEDIGRMKTQRNFLKAVIKKTLSLGNITKIKEFLDISKKYVKTNMSFDLLKKYIPCAVNFDIDNLETGSLPGSPEKCNKVWLFVHNSKKVTEYFNELNQNLFGDSNSEKEDASEIKIELLNGSGKSSNLTKITKLLKDSGYVVSKVGNTNSTSKTSIINKNNVSNKVLNNIKEIIGAGYITTTASESQVDLTIIIGKDIK